MRFFFHSVVCLSLITWLISWRLVENISILCLYVTMKEHCPNQSNVNYSSLWLLCLSISSWKLKIIFNFTLWILWILIDWPRSMKFIRSIHEYLGCPSLNSCNDLIESDHLLVVYFHISLMIRIEISNLLWYHLDEANPQFISQSLFIWPHQIMILDIQSDIILWQSSSFNDDVMFSKIQNQKWLIEKSSVTDNKVQDNGMSDQRFWLVH